MFARYNGWLITLSVFFLCTLGLVMLTSTSIWSEGDGKSYYHLGSQAKWLVIGVLGAIAAAVFDYRKLQTHAHWILFGACFLLVLCYVPGIGVEANGERRWIRLPGLGQFQPSECAKIALMLSLAAFLTKNQAEILRFDRGFVRPCMILGLPVALIFFEKDMGTATALGAAGAFVLFVAGTRLRYLTVAAVGAAGALVYMVLQNQNRMERIMAFQNLEATRLDKGLQQWRALLAFANGGTDGLGLGNGVEKHGYLPFAHTDFIFAMVGEEMGLKWTLGVVAAFIAIAFTGTMIAIHTKCLFGKLLAVGLVASIVMPALVNIGVVTALLPNTGLPLPFLSYGGSNLVFTLAAVGLLISIHRHNEPEEISELPVINQRKVAVRL